MIAEHVATDSPAADLPQPRRPSRKRKVLTVAGGAFATLALAAGGVGYWALDRYVIDHVEISDVAAFEASVKANTTTIPTATAAAAVAAAASTTGATVSTGSTAGATTVKAATATTASGASTATTSAAVTAKVEPTVTATSYVDGQAKVTISKVVTGTGSNTVTSYVADVQLTDSTRLRSAFANNKFGNNIVADTSKIATANNAVFAINGDYYGFRESGIVIRNGVVYRDRGTRTGLAIYADGHMAVFDETATSGEQLIAQGVVNTLSFGPALLDGGQIPGGIEDVEVDTNVGNHSIQGNQPRTGLGMISPNHFVFVVVDGRSNGYSKGVTMTEFAQMFKDLGATVAYNLDGGGSSTMYFNGELVNNPLGRGQERGTSDILYIS